MKPGAMTFLSGAALLIPATVGMFLTGGPTVLGPLPALTVIPTFALGIPATPVPTLLFFAWNPALFKGSVTMPKRTYWLFIAAAVLNAVWFAAGWKFGLHYQGATYTYSVCAINVAWIAILGTILMRSHKANLSFASNIFAHWLLFAWLAWFAFPYLGELP